jgi:hypothetical protein
MNLAKTISNFTVHNATNNLACQVFEFIKVLLKVNASKKNSPFDYVKYIFNHMQLSFSLTHYFHRIYPSSHEILLRVTF